MLKADWRSFSEANLVQRLLTLFHLEEFEPTLPLLDFPTRNGDFWQKIKTSNSV